MVILVGNGGDVLLVLLCCEALCGETVDYLWLASVFLEELRTDLTMARGMIFLASVKYFSQITSRDLHKLRRSQCS